MIVGLGVAQLVSWGTLIYAVAVLGEPMAIDLGVSTTAVFGAFSLSLAVSGLAAPRLGKLIDRVGGRQVLALGSLAAAVSLCAVALAPTLELFVLAWGLAGVARAMTLYEAAFATLSQHASESFRQAVTAITLIGGLAGTVFFPMSLIALEHLGWRGTLLAFAACELTVCLPLHLWCVPAGSGTRAPGAKVPFSTTSGSTRDIPLSRYVALATSFALTAFITSALSVHVISLLQAKGFAAAAAVAVASLIGPMQIAGRVMEFSFGRHFSSRAIGTTTLVVLVSSLIVLLFVSAQIALAIVFAVAYGWANGVQTIVRGTVPAELFGHAGYGHLMGRLAFPSFVARAVAPIALSVAGATILGADFSVYLLVGAAVLALVTYRIATRGMTKS